MSNSKMLPAGGRCSGASAPHCPAVRRDGSLGRNRRVLRRKKLKLGKEQMTEDSWGIVRKQLLKTVGENNFASWIEPLTVLDFDGGILRFLVPTKFMRDWVSRNFADTILNQFRQNKVAVERVEFHVATPEARPAPAARPATRAGSKSAETRPRTPRPPRAGP